MDDLKKKNEVAELGSKEKFRFRQEQPTTVTGEFNKDPRDVGALEGPVQTPLRLPVYVPHREDHYFSSTWGPVVFGSLGCPDSSRPTSLYKSVFGTSTLC